MATAREGAGLVVADDILYCLGGYDGFQLLNSMEAYVFTTFYLHCAPSLFIIADILCSADLTSAVELGVSVSLCICDGQALGVL